MSRHLKRYNLLCSFLLERCNFDNKDHRHFRHFSFGHDLPRGFHNVCDAHYRRSSSFLPTFKKDWAHITRGIEDSFQDVKTKGGHIGGSSVITNRNDHEIAVMICVFVKMTRRFRSGRRAQSVVLGTKQVLHYVAASEDP